MYGVKLEETLCSNEMICVNGIKDVEPLDLMIRVENTDALENIPLRS